MEGNVVFSFSNTMNLLKKYENKHLKVFPVNLLELLSLRSHFPVWQTAFVKHLFCDTPHPSLFLPFLPLQAQLAFASSVFCQSSNIPVLVEAIHPLIHPSTYNVVIIIINSTMTERKGELPFTVDRITYRIVPRTQGRGTQLCLGMRERWRMLLLQGRSLILVALITQGCFPFPRW